MGTCGAAQRRHCPLSITLGSSLTRSPFTGQSPRSLVSALVGILEDRGQVDVSQPISLYIPALIGSDFATN